MDTSAESSSPEFVPPQPPPIETIIKGEGESGGASHAQSRLAPGPEGETGKVVPYIAFDRVSKSFGSL